MIEAKNLSVTIGAKKILDRVSAKIEAGKVTAILGPNGAGKSTLLKSLTGSQKIARGTVTLHGKPLHDYSLSALSRKRAVLSQSNPISFPFTAREIVMMGRHPYEATSTASHDHEIVLETLKCVDALHLENRVFLTLSGGEQQRVQLARVLAQLWKKKNAYLFFDEPTSALDLKHQHQLLSLVSKLAKEDRFAVCLIIHDLNLAMGYADKVILLKDGKVLATGKTRTALNVDSIEKAFEVPKEVFLFSSHLAKHLT